MLTHFEFSFGDPTLTFFLIFDNLFVVLGVSDDYGFATS